MGTSVFKCSGMKTTHTCRYFSLPLVELERINIFWLNNITYERDRKRVSMSTGVCWAVTANARRIQYFSNRRLVAVWPLCGVVACSFLFQQSHIKLFWSVYLLGHRPAWVIFLDSFIENFTIDLKQLGIFYFVSKSDFACINGIIGKKKKNLF